MHIAVGICGASGAPIAVSLLAALREQEVSLIITPEGQHLLDLEAGEVELPATRRYHYLDFESPLASSSRLPDALVVCPCTMRTLAAIAHGLCDNLITRCADNILRLGRPLVIVPRETPLSLAALDNLRAVKAAGAFVVPPMLTYYYHPQSVQEMTDFAAGKVLDCLRLPHDRYRRWGEGASIDTP